VVYQNRGSGLLVVAKIFLKLTIIALEKMSDGLQGCVTQVGVIGFLSSIELWSLFDEDREPSLLVSMFGCRAILSFHRRRPTAVMIWQGCRLHD
jgi:hypothetical protein